MDLSRDNILIVIFVLVVALYNHGPIFSTAAKLPSSFQKCDKNDPNINVCLKSAIAKALKVMKNGIPSFQLEPIDPLNISYISLNRGANGPVNLHFEMTNSKLEGLDGIEIKSVRSDLKNHFFDVDAYVPVLILEGDYDMDGRFLLLPLHGDGKAKLTLTSFNANLKMKADGKKVNGQKYWDVKSFDIKLTNIKNFHVNFENLFNGDPILGPTTNIVLNENWEGFWREIGPSLEETIGRVFTSVANVIFSQVQEKDLFLNDNL